MKKKAISIFLAAAMTLSLTACGGKQETAGESTVPAASEAGTNTESVSVDEGEQAADENPYGFEEPFTIKVGFGDAGADIYGGETIEKNTWSELYNENNIFLDILYNVDATQGATKLSTSIMSGDYPDILFANTSEYVNYANSGVTADITEVFEKYASDELKDYLYSDGGLAMECLTVDGKLYGLPKMSSSYDKLSMMFIRKDWLENLGLGIPETMEELKAVAHAFTYEDPDGNGKNDTYGLAINGVDVIKSGMGDTSAIFDGFGAHVGIDGMGMVEDADGMITWGGTNAEAMKSGVTFLRDLYEDGSLAKDFVTMTDANVTEEASAGRCGIFCAPMWGAMDPGFKSMKADINSHFICIPVPDGTGDGNTKSFYPVAFDGVFCVSSQCEKPEVLIKMMNMSVHYLCHPADAEEYYRYYGDRETYTGWKPMCVTPTMTPQKNYECYKKMSDSLTAKDTSELNPYELDIYNSIITYTDAVEAGTFDPQDDSFAGPVGRYTVYGDPEGSYAVIDQMVKADSFVPSAYNAPLTDEQADMAGTLKKMTAETIVKIVTGAAQADDYDSFLQNWLASGGQDYIDDAQAWVDENK